MAPGEMATKVAPSPLCSLASCMVTAQQDTNYMRQARQADKSSR